MKGHARSYVEDGFEKDMLEGRKPIKKLLRVLSLILMRSLNEVWREKYRLKKYFTAKLFSIDVCMWG